MNYINIIMFLFIISFLQSQTDNFSVDDENNLELDQFKINNDAFIAFSLSAILPGAGQIYNKDYKRGLFYLSFELFNWLKRSKYLDKGDQLVNEYKDFANEHWQFDKWIRDINLFANPNHPVYSVMIDSNGDFFYPWQDSHHIEFYLDGYLRKTNSSNNWFKNTYIDNCEDAYINNEQCNTDYFQNAQVTKDHHFYEGIGKYDLFFAGWDDTHQCESLGEDEDCSYLLFVNNANNSFTENKRYYQHELRDKSNKNYDIAENALTFIFINHAVSMLDAFIVNLVGHNSDFNYMTKPIYDDNINLNGLEFSIQW